MSDTNVVDMMRCSYCKTYVVGGEELVCEKCVDKVEADFVLADLITSIERLEELDDKVLNARFNLIMKAQYRLTIIKDKLKKRKNLINGQ